MRHDDREPCCWTPYPEGRPPYASARRIFWVSMALALLFFAASLFFAVRASRADVRLPDGSSESEPGVRPAPGYVHPVAVKRWYYLPRQRAWVWGYRRYDGLIVGDPGTKRQATGKAPSLPQDASPSPGRRIYRPTSENAVAHRVRLRNGPSCQAMNTRNNR